MPMIQAPARKDCLVSMRGHLHNVVILFESALSPNSAA